VNFCIIDILIDNKYNNNSNSTCGFVDKTWTPLYSKAYRDFLLVDNL